MTKKKWSDAQIIEIQALWIAGKSYGQIAKIFEVSRSAMSGFIFRNPELFTPKGSNINYAQRGKREKPVSRINKKEVWVEEPPRAIPPPPGAKSIPWIELETNQCQWHMNDGMSHFHDPPSNKFPCCGLPVELPNRFCEYHMKSARK